MDDAETVLSTVAGALLIALLIASLGGLGLWLHRWATRGYVLPYQPRQPVPWGLGAVLPAIVMTMLGISSSLAMRAPPVEAPPFDAAEYLQGQLMSVGTQLLFFLAILATLIVVCGATRYDLGLPASLSHLVADIGLGLWVALAAMIPVYGTQYLAVVLLGIDAGHPLLDQTQANPDWRVFAAAGLAAVVAAPVLEEVLFRLLMQGGLEHWEHQHLLPTESTTDSSPLANDPLPADVADESPDSGTISPSVAPGSELWVAPPICPEHQPAVAPSTHGVLPGLSQGWGPIIASSFVFAMAHLGAGPSPIPLFVFALFLGYVYHRTHRIVPCIVAHMLLNATSIVLLILTLDAS